MLFWAIVLIAAAVVLYAIIVFNSLVRTRQMANEAWSGIDVQLKRRSELVPNLVESVKGYATHERSVLEEVTRLRNAAREVPSDDVAGRAQAERALTTAIGKLVALAVGSRIPLKKKNALVVDLVFARLQLREVGVAQVLHGPGDSRPQRGVGQGVFDAIFDHSGSLWLE